MKGGGLVPPPHALPLPTPAADMTTGECGMQGTFHKLGESAGKGSEFAAASAYVMVNPQTGERTGVLALRSFVESQMAIHSVLAALAAARIDSLMLDMRGNSGGDVCHIYDLAYLLSNHLNSPEDAQQRLAMHVRRSAMVDELVYGQSMASGTRMPNGLGPKDPRMVVS